MVAGAGGGAYGPSGVYPHIANELASLGIPALRSEYRVPNAIGESVEDAMSAVNYLVEKHGVDKCVLIGWSFGGAVVITTGVNSDHVVRRSTHDT